MISCYVLQNGGDGLATLARDQFGNALTRKDNFSRLDRDVAGMTGNSAAGLMDQESRMSSTEYAAAMRDECVAALYDLHRRVSGEEAAAILLREVFEADYSDIARAASKTESATRQLVHRALTRVHAIQSRNPAALFQMIGAPHVTAHLSAAPVVVLCTVSVGPAENAPASTIE